MSPVVHFSFWNLQISIVKQQDENFDEGREQLQKMHPIGIEVRWDQNKQLKERGAISF